MASNDPREMRGWELETGDILLDENANPVLTITKSLGDNSVSELFEYITPVGRICLWSEDIVAVLPHDGPREE